MQAPRFCWWKTIRATPIWRAIRHAIIRARLEAELRELASTDYLTGLPNRRHFFAQMEAELARSSASMASTLRC